MKKDAVDKAIDLTEKNINKIIKSTAMAIKKI